MRGEHRERGRDRERVDDGEWGENRDRERDRERGEDRDRERKGTGERIGKGGDRG